MGRMKMIIKLAIKTVLFSLIFSSCLLIDTFGQDNCKQGFHEAWGQTENVIIGSTFKALAKAFVVVVDLNKVKKSNIKKIQKMDNEKFKKRQAAIYDVLKDLPLELKEKYGIVEQMPKEQLVRIMNSLDKNKIYDMINDIPDYFIAYQFKKYIKEKGKDIENSSIVAEVNKFWNSMIKKAS